jgi:hypothetical protein
MTRHILQPWELKLCDNHVMELLGIMQTKGHVPDEGFLKNGFPAETNIQGRASAPECWNHAGAHTTSKDTGSQVPDEAVLMRKPVNLTLS